MQASDKDTFRTVRKELVRHALDTAEAQVYVMRGLVHLQGRVRPLAGREGDFESEVNGLYKALKSHPEIRDVIMDWETPSNSGAKTRKTH